MSINLKPVLDESDFQIGDILEKNGSFRFGGNVQEHIRDTMVYRRLPELGLSYREIIETLSGLYYVYRSVKESVPGGGNGGVKIHGTRVSELNSMVAGRSSVIVAGDLLLFDEPLYVEKASLWTFEV